MKKAKQLNNWIIKEKREDEVPMGINLESRFVVFSPEGVFMEDNLTFKQAEEFCSENLEHVVRKIRKAA